MSIQAMKQALEALDNWCDLERSYNERNLILDSRTAITALRAAIEAAEKQEPVASVDAEALSFLKRNDDWIRARLPNKESLNLYTRPQPAIPDGLQATLDYTVLHQYADDIGINYNDLCAIVRTSIIGFAVPKPENSHE